MRQGKYISVKEAAYRLNKSPDAVYQWLRAGRLKGIQPGGRGCEVLVEIASLESALRCTYP
jgi:excisionase family DNA binding protein